MLNNITVNHRQAMEMIHGLIDDSECNVEEVIQRVSSAHNTSTSQSEESAHKNGSAAATVAPEPSPVPTVQAVAQKKPTTSACTTPPHASPEVFSAFRRDLIRGRFSSAIK